MQLEAIRIVADWLGDATSETSVNYYLTNVELDAGDERPSDVTVYDSTRHGWVARRRLSREGSNVAFPALAILPVQAQGEGNVATIVRDGQIDIAIVYVDQEHETASGTAAALYTLRAVRRSLNQLNQNANATSRTRGSIYLKNWQSWTESAAEMQYNDAVVVAPSIITTWTIRDQAPSAPAA